MKKPTSLKWKIFKYITIFMSFLLCCLFLFQVVFLQLFYEMVKKNDLINITHNIEKYLYSDNIDEILKQNSKSNEMCIMIFDANNSLSLNSNIGCPMNALTFNEIIEYGQKAIEEGGELLVKTSIPSFDIRQKNNAKLVVQSKAFDSLIYFKVINEQTFIIVSTTITPINATNKTLQIQLMFISIIVVFATVLLTYILTNRFIKPIEDINEAAKLLPDGLYHNKEYFNSLELYELNKTLNQAAKDINKAEKAKRDLIANISHDLKTPLTMISGYGEMMLDLPNEKSDENIKVIIDEAKRLNHLVNDLLDFEKLKDNKAVINKMNFNITQLINEIIKTYNRYVINEGFNIEFIYQDEVMVNLDKLKISQVIHNFINNAINYAGDNKKIIIYQKCINDKVIIEITDFGEGIKEDDLPYIWDRYYKVDTHHKRFNNGSGIGLAIAKEILELHNIDYGVKSTLNKGSTFYFSTQIISL